jgi:hypothetical protein
MAFLGLWAFSRCASPGAGEPLGVADGGSHEPGEVLGDAGDDGGPDAVGGQVDASIEARDAGLTDAGLTDAGVADAGVADAGWDGGFSHPGVLLGTAQLAFIKGRIAANAAPWTSAFTTVKARSLSSLGYTPHPVATIDRANSSAANVVGDAIAAYSDALIYALSGDVRYADKSITILNGWAATLSSVDANAQLDAVWASEVFPRAAELVRHTYRPAAGHPSLDLEGITRMFRQVLLPQLSPTSAGAIYSNGNWQLSMAEGTLAIAVFTDDHALFASGLATWRARVPAYIYLSSDGADPVAPPGGVYDSSAKLKCFWANAPSVTSTCTLPSHFRYLDGMSQETCRDASHVTLGFEAMMNAAETARLQGVDLYAEEQVRIVTGYEFAANQDLQALAHLDDAGTSGAVDASVCGGRLALGGTAYTLGFELALNHYATRLGLAMPYTEQLVRRIRPTGAALHMDYETLTFVGTP